MVVTLGQQYNVGEKPTAILYTYINHHASVSTIGEGGDKTIPSPGMAPKQPLPGIRLHDPLHGRQACPEFSSFHQGLVLLSPLEGLFSYRPLLKRGQIYYIPAPPPLSLKASCTATNHNPT